MWRDEIVKTDILYINPPSGINLQYKVYVAVLKILKAVPVKIYLELSKQALKNMYDLESFGEYLISEETLTKAWDFKTGVMVEKKLGPGKEWVRFVLSSV